VQNFDTVDVAHGRLRWLADDTVGRGAWQLLWIPPSLPYLQPAGPYADRHLAGFTKRLVFSSWTMVPKAIATLLTYDAERRINTAGSGPRYTNTADGRSGRARLLDFAQSGDRLTGMPVFGLLYPSVELARVGDQLALTNHADGESLTSDNAVAIVADRIRDLLDRVIADINDAGQDVPTSGRVDDRWYWAAPMWLDSLASSDHVVKFFANDARVYRALTGGERNTGGEALREHIETAGDVAILDYPSDLGRMPDDLPEVLARMALTAPGPAALRALARVTGRPFGDIKVRFAACRVAWALRSLFNGPDVTELVRGMHPGEPYWQRILDYSLAGNLQAVLDEYAHVLIPAQGHLDVSGDKVVADLAAKMHDTINLRTVNYTVNDITTTGQRVVIERSRLRANFALRLADERADDGSQTRASEVRDAFNSPFWPFVLATTSAGQEGLDFHPYCHAIVHWNLPSNPVDLEQREGRIHRFKGHAVRRNVAADYQTVGRSAAGDPWEAMFDAAHANPGHADRPESLTDIVPYWVYTRDGGAAIERYVPALPLSRDRTAAERLKRAVASYRLAFGHARQDDLLAYLAGEIDPDTLERLTAELGIDLSPPRRPTAPPAT
jgi:hypothetical protein